LRLVQPIRPFSSEQQQGGGMANEEGNQAKIDSDRECEFQKNDQQRGQDEACQHGSSAFRPHLHQATKGNVHKWWQAGGQNRPHVPNQAHPISPAQADEHRLQGAKGDKRQKYAVCPHIVSASKEDDEHDHQQQRHDERQGNEKHDNHPGAKPCRTSWTRSRFGTTFNAIKDAKNTWRRRLSPVLPRNTRFSCALSPP